MKQRGMLAAFALFASSILGKIQSSLGAKPRYMRESGKIPGGGGRIGLPRRRQGKSGLRRNSAKLWHALSVGHSSAAGWSDRKTRHLCATGYRSNPRAEHFKRPQANPIERLGDAFTATMRPGYAKP